MSFPVVIRELGLRDYSATWKAMRHFTAHRRPEHNSEIWLLEHPPVFTQGQAGKPEHLLDPGAIPVVQSDRGGQITYHAPGQIIAYLLLDLKQTGKGIRSLVRAMEDSVIALLETQGISAYGKPKAPGVYVDEKKIAALGLRVKRGYTYHGLALNHSLDLAAYSRINPCGYAGQKVTRMIDLGIHLSQHQTQRLLIQQLAQTLDFTPLWTTDD